MYIWSEDAWPAWQYDLERLAHPLSEVALAQGILLGRLMDIGADQRDMRLAGMVPGNPEARVRANQLHAQ